MAQFRKVLVLVCLFVCFLAAVVSVEVTSQSETEQTTEAADTTNMMDDATPKPNAATSVAYSLTVMAGCVIYSLFL